MILACSKSILLYHLISHYLTDVSYSGANVYAEDHSLCTPVLIAAAGRNNEAFHHLMKFMDLQDEKKNPVFKALNVTLNRIEILRVS